MIVNRLPCFHDLFNIAFLFIFSFIVIRLPWVFNSKSLNKFLLLRIRIKTLLTSWRSLNFEVSLYIFTPIFSPCIYLSKNNSILRPGLWEQEYFVALNERRDREDDERLSELIRHSNNNYQLREDLPHPNYLCSPQCRDFFEFVFNYLRCLF